MQLCCKSDMGLQSVECFGSTGSMKAVVTMTMLWLLVGLFMGIAKDELPADLLRERQLHLVALWLAKRRVTLFHGHSGVLHFWLIHTLFLNLDLTG